jgi:hypothetical protein
MARIASSRGQLSDLDRTLLENTYRVRIAPEGRVYTVEREIDVSGRKAANANQNTEDTKEQAAETSEETSTTDDRAATSDPAGANDSVVIELGGESRQQEPEGTQEPMERLRAKYTPKGIRLVSDDPYVVIEKLADSVIDQHARIQTLEREAKDGRDFRAGLLTELDASVVRAFGQDTASDDQARYRRMAANEDVEGVKALIRDLEKRSPFEAGRATRDVVEDGEGDIETPADRPARKRGRTPAHLIG